jgi:hypothetical protein
MKKCAYLNNDGNPSSENVVWMIKSRRWMGGKKSEA